MTIRKTPLVVGEIYHVFNRSIARQPIFINISDCQRALDVLSFYTYFNPPLRFSHYKRLPQTQKNKFLDSLMTSNQRQVGILAFSLMPNHIHLLIKEIREKGISIFMSNFQNSYAKYFNLKNDRVGGLFQQMFKAVHIETEEQLTHTARYIHLNPVTAFIVKNIDYLSNHPWNSFSAYTGKVNLDFLNKDLLLSLFPSVNHLVQFTKDQVDYQRKLDRIKHLLLE